MLDRIKGFFTESIQTQIAAAEALPDAISRAAMTLVQSLLNGGVLDKDGEKIVLPYDRIHIEFNSDDAAA